MDYVGLIFRWMHILAAIAMVGGTYFWRFVLWPTLRTLDENQRADLMTPIRKRWAPIVMAGTAFLLLSGFWNAIAILNQYAFPSATPLYHILVTVKLVLALVVFFFAARLSGRSEGAARFREKMGTWLNVTVALATALVLIAGYMKMVDRTPKVTDISSSDPVNQAAVWGP